MANGTKKSGLISAGFWGGFVKSFESMSSARKKRQAENVTTPQPVDVKIDTIILMAEKINTTFHTTLKDAITATADLEPGVIIGKICDNGFNANF